MGGHQPRDPGWWQIGPLLALITVVGLAAWLLGWSMRGAGPAPPVDQTPTPWDWLERASWLAGLLGLATAGAGLWVAVRLGVPQLRFIREEQRRIADELTSRPRLDVGFTHGHPRRAITSFERTALDIAPRWRSGPPATQPASLPFSEPIQLSMVVYNVGKRSARNVSVEAYFPHSTRTPGDLPAASPPVGDTYTVVNGENGVVIRAHWTTLHPAQGQLVPFALQVRRVTPTLIVTLHASMDDAPVAESDFVVRLGGSTG